jgi:uncharacterized membrane protein YccF (DUF307 family)
MTPTMRLVLNIIWLVLCGFWMSILWVLAGIVMCVLIIAIPLGIQAFKTANYVLWPFGRTIVKRDDAGVGSLLGNVIWILLVGWELAIGHLVTGVLLAITIIGIPLAAANFKLIPISLVPFGRVIVPTSQSSSAAGITES